jgi:serine/threonine-protein kinase RsbW
MGATSAIRLVFPSTPEDAQRAIQQIVESVKAQRYGEAAVFAVRLAVDEAITNAIRHGNRGDRSKKVTVEYAVDDRQFRCSIADEGEGFRPQDLPDPTLDENLERPSGRGILLMRSYMTEVSFNEKGNRVTLIKRRDCCAPGDRAHAQEYTESPGRG